MHDPQKVRGRFEISRDGDGWTVNDYAYGLCLSWETKREAEDAARFCREYCRRHGDINMESFPFSINEPLTDEDRASLAALAS